MPGFASATRTQVEYQGEAIAQFCGFLVDLPFIIMGVLMCAIVWRAPFMFMGLPKEYSASDRRKLVFRHVLWTFVDVLLDIWFVLGAILIMVSLVRAPSLLQALRQDYKLGDSLDNNRVRCRLRSSVGVFLLMWVLDLPALVLMLCILVTLWRAPRLVKLLTYAAHTRRPSHVRPCGHCVAHGELRCGVARSCTLTHTGTARRVRTTWKRTSSATWTRHWL